ncbi:MAG: hypothetical protein M1825_000903 [Sarcosagium campestre]|nr:MAG: hypothetical protein M1825_000903 [Sarcosagium campestre]
MATAKVSVPTSDRSGPELRPLPPAAYPSGKLQATPNAAEVVSTWLSSFNKVIGRNDTSKLSGVFLAESYWRDQLCLSWDFRTLNGPDKVASFVKSQKKGFRLKSLAIDERNAFCAPTVSAVDFHGQVKCVQTFLRVETDVGNGRGVVRLIQDAKDRDIWKVFTLFTALHELNGHEELIGKRRPTGVVHGEVASRTNWKDRKDALQNMEDGREPTVVIIGAGQGGLACAARLKALGVESLIVDRNERIGDNWRNRYHQLVLHDPVWYDHLPYLPFPKTWPVFTPKDKLGDWFESYASIMELNVWMQSSIKAAKWDDSEMRWTVEIDRMGPGDHETRVLHPSHIIQATGHSGEPNFPSNIKGLDTFKGDLLVHSSQFRGAKKNSQGKKAVVVGCCNSGHDIAHDFYENGYDVTMVQRSSTTVVSSASCLDVLMGGLYDESGPPTEDADLFFQSIPNAVLKRYHVDATVETERRDAPTLAGLTAAGFALDRGSDDAGFFIKYLERGGGYYIDVGASQLIVDGKIKVKQGHEIASVHSRSLVFDDGSELEADEIVFATGYQNMRGMARKIFGDKVADRVESVWGFDGEGEIRTMWRRSGHPGFWFFGGNLALSRYYSRMLALQIKALDVKMATYEDA